MDKPSQLLRPWVKREPLAARKLTEAVTAVNTLITGTMAPRQVVASGRRAGVQVAQFRIKEIAGDFLVCRKWNGVNEEALDIRVVKSYLLRRTPFDGLSRDGITYTYTSDTARQANDGSQTEDQIVVPDWVLDDVIYATRNIAGGTGVWVEGVPLEWLDENRDARAWAKASE